MICGCSAYHLDYRGVADSDLCLCHSDQSQRYNYSDPVEAPPNMWATREVCELNRRLQRMRRRRVASILRSCRDAGGHKPREDCSPNHYRTKVAKRSEGSSGRKRRRRGSANSRAAVLVSDVAKVLVITALFLTRTSMTDLWTRDGSQIHASPGDILPLELWELIFRHIECDPELLCLARVCRTFNAVSIRLLLARHGQGQDVFDRTDLQLSVHTLPGLYLSLRSFSATRVVTCSLDGVETWRNIHLLDALLTRVPNLRRLDLEFDHDLLDGLAGMNRAFRDMVASVVHRTTGPVFIFLKHEIYSCWPRDVDVWDPQQSLSTSPGPDRGTKTGGWLKRVRRRFSRKPVPAAGKILLHARDIRHMKNLFSLRAVSIQLVEGNKHRPCAILILDPGKVNTICLDRSYRADIPAVDLDGALVHVALPSLRRVIIRTDKADPTALRTFLANHPLVSDITYNVSDEVPTSTHKLIDPPLAHPTLALLHSATNALGSASLLSGLQDSPNLYEFGFSFPAMLESERLALLLEDLRLVAVRTRATKLTLGIWRRQHPAQPAKFWASGEDAREVARAMHAVHVYLVKTSTIRHAQEMIPWLAQLPSAAEIHFEIHDDLPSMVDFPPGFNPQQGIPEFLEAARAALVSVRDITARYIIDDWPNF
ncbi:hypothetical protein C8R45DRAFT_1084445 [Mycena sanguinolenta]|nr:hypothetical protein C8R45DRAFT_1084445 [Mycena sanguinolenta]